MSDLAIHLRDYLALCRERFQVLLDRQAFTLRLALDLQAAIEDLEESDPFTQAALAFEQHVDWQATSGVIAESWGAARLRHHLSRFMANQGIYDQLARGEELDSGGLAATICHEVKRTDVVLRNAAHLEGFTCDVGRVSVGDFVIRHLADDEINRLFVGGNELHQKVRTEDAVQWMAGEWFAVMEHPAHPLQESIGHTPIGFHNFLISPFRYVNLALNLYKAGSGPVVIRRIFECTTGSFQPRVYSLPEPSYDPYPSSWDDDAEPPRLTPYHLSEADCQRLSAFWNQFKVIFYQHAPHFIPDHLHRAVDHFLRACQCEHNDWRFRQLLYLMALEALWSGNDVRPTKSDGKTLGVRATLTCCCANVLGPDQASTPLLKYWLGQVYQQRSGFVHGSTFEQKIFHEQPQDPDEHQDAVRLCRMLGIDSSQVCERSDIEFAVLHNVTRMSLLVFMQRSHGLLTSSRGAALVGRIANLRGELSGPGSATPQWLARHNALRQELARLQLDDKRELLSLANGCYRDEARRKQLRESLLRLAMFTV